MMRKKERMRLNNREMKKFFFIIEINPVVKSLYTIIFLSFRNI